ncbi:MAG: MarC family protein [Candidatus Omnitrophica bacterium]|nr:MarC family protein [Candidatus Omnitrophota bacterium]
MCYKIILSFIPLFVAVDALGNIPSFISLSEGFTSKQRRHVVNESIAIATLAAVLFIFIGKRILQIIGITASDFKIAGGILLLVLSIYFLLPGKKRFFSSQAQHIGIFPLAAPLITGPAVLTTSLILLDSFGPLLTLSSLILNMLIAWIFFLGSVKILRFIGEAGLCAISSISDIILAAYALMLIHRGINEIFFF